MNREQKRAKIKEFQKKYGLSALEAKDVLNRYLNPKINLYEGTKVQLNYKEMESHPDWGKLNPKYKEFVENNRNTIFTVEYDPIKKKNNTSDKSSMVCLKEDITVPKWLFFTSDLIIADQTGAVIDKGKNI